MTQPTVTLPREVVQKAIDALEYASRFVYENCVYEGAVKDHENAVYDLRAALAAPATVDCRGCDDCHSMVLCTRCIDGDKFNALPIVRKYKVTK